MSYDEENEGVGFKMEDGEDELPEAGEMPESDFGLDEEDPDKDR